MGTFIKFKPNKRNSSIINGTGKRMKEGALRGLKEGMKIVLADAKKFGKAGGLKIKTGALRDSIDYTVTEKGDSFIGVLGSDSDYAAIHEFGGESGRGLKSIMPKRPFLEPAVRDNEDELNKIINKEILASFKRRF